MIVDRVATKYPREGTNYYEVTLHIWPRDLETFCAEDYLFAVVVNAINGIANNLIVPNRNVLKLSRTKGD